MQKTFVVTPILGNQLGPAPQKHVANRQEERDLGMFIRNVWVLMIQHVDAAVLPTQALGVFVHASLSRTMVWDFLQRRYRREEYET